MSVQGDKLAPVPQHTPPLQGQEFKFDVTWMRWFLDLQFKANVINGPVLLPSAGGTGISSYSIGDLLYASGTTTLNTLAAGTLGYVLTSNGPLTAPSWQPAAGGGGGISRGVGLQLQNLPVFL